MGDKLLDEPLTALRVHGTFTDTSPQVTERVQTLRRALVALTATLDGEGRLLRSNPINLGSGGATLEEQLSRLRHNVGDPGVLLGGAKELLESIYKFVLEEQSMVPDRQADLRRVVAGTSTMEPADYGRSRELTELLRLSY